MSYVVKLFHRWVEGDSIRMIQFLWLAQDNTTAMCPYRQTARYLTMKTTTRATDASWILRRMVVCNALRKAADYEKLIRLILLGQALMCIAAG